MIPGIGRTEPIVPPDAMNPLSCLNLHHVKPDPRRIGDLAMTGGVKID